MILLARQIQSSDRTLSGKQGNTTQRADSLVQHLINKTGVNSGQIFAAEDFGFAFQQSATGGGFPNRKSRVGADNSLG